MSDAQLAMLLEQSKGNPPPQNGDIQALRDWFEGLNAVFPMAPETQVQRVNLGPCSVDLLSSPDSDPGKLVIYYHGGGFIMGSAQCYNTITSFLAQAGGVTVLSVDYRLAPESPPPAGHEDCLHAYQWALAQGYQPGQIALAGDSAGGNLALSTAVSISRLGLPQPAAMVAMSPALDLANDTESHTTLADAPLLNRAMSELFLTVFIGDGDRRSPAVTPFYSPLPVLPPVLLHVGSTEMLRDDSVVMAERIRAAGGQAELKLWPGMCHSWQLFAPALDEGMQSIVEAAAFIRRYMG